MTLHEYTGKLSDDFYLSTADLMKSMDVLQGWNLRRLDSMLSRTLDKNKVQIPGVSTPFLYFGMWRSIFAW